MEPLQSRPVSRLSNLPDISHCRENSLSQALLTDSDESLEMYQLNLNIETEAKLSSLQSSLELPEDTPSRELNPRFTPNQSTLKQVTEIYLNENECFGSSLRSISDMSFSEFKENEPPLINPEAEVRHSTVYTNLSSDESRYQNEIEEPFRCKNYYLSPIRKKKRRQMPIEESLEASIFKSTLNFNPVSFCEFCEIERTTVVKIEEGSMGLWDRFLVFFSSFKCCSDPREAVASASYYCSVCGKKVKK